jgi:glucose-1-phosphate cytidylyltransferase
MQVVILAGGYGTRLSEETDSIPKPMVRIGPDPILVHIMRYFAAFGHSDFIIASGYKHELIEGFFAEFEHPWNVNVVNTGLDVGTGGRLLKLTEYLDDTFLLTYGDGLGNVDLTELQSIFSQNNFLVVVTAVRPPARFGSIKSDGNLVTSFQEKNPHDEGWINGGFFICNKQALSLIPNLEEPWEGEPMTQLVQASELGVMHHTGWWQAMDTLRDKRQLEAIWRSGSAPWVITENENHA